MHIVWGEFFFLDNTSLSLWTSPLTWETTKSGQKCKIICSKISKSWQTNENMWGQNLGEKGTREAGRQVLEWTNEQMNDQAGEGGTNGPTLQGLSAAHAAALAPSLSLSLLTGHPSCFSRSGVCREQCLSVLPRVCFHLGSRSLLN